MLRMKELNAMESMRGFEFQSAFQRNETESIIGGGFSGNGQECFVNCEGAEFICDPNLWRR